MAAEGYDPPGRRVRRLCDLRLDSGAHDLRWDGTDDLGRALGLGTQSQRHLATVILKVSLTAPVRRRVR